ncbi:MAG: C69 family dipeptidase [Sphingobacteriales bacterium]|jgi:dipeptidase|nr:C69 family dipeptidase [Sphingobacteriales bacterium]
MCDTFVHIPSQKSGSVIFGKNSDREPNEAQQIVHYPRKIRVKVSRKATFIELEVPVESYEVILSKPFQIWGAEMGCNEFGVTIGNEAVFTKMPFDKKQVGLTGMDLLRLSLEISKTAKDGVDNIIHFLEKYGQDACGGYMDKNFYYHNSFIIADKNEGYVLETAGRHWIYEKVTGYRAISNGLSIAEKYDGISKDAIAFAQKKGWTKKQENFNFKKAYSQWLMPKLAGCEYRRNNSEDKGKSFSGFTVENAIRILRSHGEKEQTFTPEQGNTRSICMHASGLFTPHQTVGSMVAELRKDKPATVWLTGTSAPCLSLFKPFYFGNDILEEENFIPPSVKADNSYWWQWEKLHRAVLKNYAKSISFLQFKQQELEKSWIKQDKILIQENWNLINARLVSLKAIKESIDVRDYMLSKSIEGNKTKTGFLYSRFWNRLDRQAGITI